MVCVPCFIIPVLLFIWHRFLQPILLRYWNPWAVKDKDGNVIENKVPEFPFECAGGQCPFPGAKAKNDLDNKTTTAATVVAAAADAEQIGEQKQVDKKND